MALPRARCPEECNQQGSCLGRPDGEPGAWCRCHKGYHGPSCKDVMLGSWDNNCFNYCSSACCCCWGWCMRGAAGEMYRRVALPGLAWEASWMLLQVPSCATALCSSTERGSSERGAVMPSWCHYKVPQHCSRILQLTQPTSRCAVSRHCCRPRHVQQRLLPLPARLLRQGLQPQQGLLGGAQGRCAQPQQAAHLRVRAAQLAGLGGGWWLRLLPPCHAYCCLCASLWCSAQAAVSHAAAATSALAGLAGPKAAAACCPAAHHQVEVL